MKIDRGSLVALENSHVRTSGIPTEKSGETASFQQALQRKTMEQQSSLTLSKHAMKRADERGVEMTPQLLNQVSAAVDRAEEKGVKDLLILGRETAFIANVPNRVIVTMMNNADMNENVFTNIDGTVIL